MYPSYTHLAEFFARNNNVTTGWSHYGDELVQHCQIEAIAIEKETLPACYLTGEH